jgi:hypothetical protein
MAGGRPRRTDLPEGIGEYPDYVVSAIAKERGENISTQGVRHLRLANEIPPPSEPYRTKWLSERGHPTDEG